MIRRLTALIAALLFASLAHAQTEPRPGTVTGLDLSSPQAGAESFIRAWLDKDYFVAYLAMDPEIRYQFQNQTWNYNFRDIYGDLPLQGFWDAYVPFVGESQSTVQNLVTVIDTFAEFNGSMRTAEVLGGLPLTFDPAAADELKPEAPDGLLARVHIATAAGGGTIVMRTSPGGLWRFFGLEGRDLPRLWRYQEPSEDEE